MEEPINLCIGGPSTEYAAAAACLRRNHQTVMISSSFQPLWSFHQGTYNIRA